MAQIRDVAPLLHLLVSGFSVGPMSRDSKLCDSKLCDTPRFQSHDDRSPGNIASSQIQDLTLFRESAKLPKDINNG